MRYRLLPHLTATANRAYQLPVARGQPLDVRLAVFAPRGVSQIHGPNSRRGPTIRQYTWSPLHALFTAPRTKSHPSATRRSAHTERKSRVAGAQQQPKIRSREGGCGSWANARYPQARVPRQSVESAMHVSHVESIAAAGNAQQTIIPGSATVSMARVTCFPAAFTNEQRDSMPRESISFISLF